MNVITLQCYNFGHKDYGMVLETHLPADEARGQMSVQKPMYMASQLCSNHLLPCGSRHFTEFSCQLGLLGSS